MAITYNAGTDVISFVGLGYDLDDIYNADVAGGWGRWLRQGGNQHLCLANLGGGDGSTPTELIDDNVHLQVGTSASHKYFKTLSNATFQLGSSGLFSGSGLTLYNPTTGGYIINYGNINLYGCVLAVNSGSLFWRLQGTIDWKDIIITAQNNATIYVYSLCTGNIERATWRWDNPYGILMYTSQVTMTDISIVGDGTCGISFNLAGKKKARDLTISADIERAIALWTVPGLEAEITNSDYPIYKIYTHPVVGSLDDYKSFKLRIETQEGTAITGATVTITDQFNNDIVETTDINGDIPDQELKSFRCVNKGVAAGMGTAYNDYTFNTPYTVKIEGAGYRTLTKKLDLLLEKHKKGVVWELSLIPITDFLEIPIDVEIESNEVNIEVDIPKITVEVE